MRLVQKAMYGLHTRIRCEKVKPTAAMVMVQTLEPECKCVALKIMGPFIDSSYFGT